LKHVGLGGDSEWIEDHVVTNVNRDFVIKRVEDAKAREAPKTKNKSGAKKRKVKSEPTVGKNNIKKTRQAEPDEDDDDTSDADNADGEASVMESVNAESVGDVDGDDDVVSLSRLTAHMEEDSDNDDASEDESESEEEAEFEE